MISDFLRYVNQDLCSPLDIGQIAAKLYVSESYLYRLFKKELHQTPQKYIREKRLLLARKMLSEGERPTAVCTHCGFSDYTTFYRNYVGLFGHAPSERERGGSVDRPSEKSPKNLEKLPALCYNDSTACRCENSIANLIPSQKGTNL